LRSVAATGRDAAPEPRADPRDGGPVGDGAT